MSVWPRICILDTSVSCNPLIAAYLGSHNSHYLVTQAWLTQHMSDLYPNLIWRGLSKGSGKGWAHSTPPVTSVLCSLCSRARLFWRSAFLVILSFLSAFQSNVCPPCQATSCCGRPAPPWRSCCEAWRAHEYRLLDFIVSFWFWK